MALLYFDGLDLYQNNRATRVDATGGSISYFGSAGGITTMGRFGGSAEFHSQNVALNNYYSGYTYTLPAIKTELWVGLAWKASRVPDPFGPQFNDNQRIISFVSSGGTELFLEFNASTGPNTWKVKKGDGTVLYTSVPDLINVGPSPNRQWHFIEIRYVYSLSSGVVEVWFNNDKLINLTGINTVAYGNDNGIASINIGDGTNMCGVTDDIYVLDTSGSTPTNNRLGDLRIYPIPMNSDAGPNNGTPSTGNTRFGVINDNNLSTYVSIPNGTGNTELYGHVSMPISATDAIGVNIIAYVSKSDAGSAKGHLKIISGSNSANGTSRTLLTTTQTFRESYTTVPGGGLWDPTLVNNSKIGWEVE